jgi:hypothetical protein
VEPERNFTEGNENGKPVKDCRNKDEENEKMKINISYFDISS